MKTKILTAVFIWYFAFGSEIYEFESKPECEQLQKYMKSTGRHVSDCASVKFSPKRSVRQQTTGPNSPTVHSEKGDVNIRIDKDGVRK